MKSLHLFIFSMFFLGACSPANAALPSPTVAPLTTSVPSATGEINTPTLPPTETAIVLPTQASGPFSSVPSCTNIEVKHAVPADYAISGRVLSLDKAGNLHNFSLAKRAETSWLNFEDYQKEIKKKKIISLEVEDLNGSPDFTKAIYLVSAYIDELDWNPQKSWLEIYDGTTNDTKRIPWKDEWSYIIGWINNEDFAIRSGGSTLILNSSGGLKKQFVASQYPDYSNPRVYDPNVFVIWGGYRQFDGYSFDSGGENLTHDYHTSRSQARLFNPTLEIYSPTLDYVIYPEVKDKKPGIVLYDIKAKRKVVEIMTGEQIQLTAFGGLPVWAPDGNSALMLLPIDQKSTKQGLFLLDTSGKVEQITTFEVPGPYSWSPDGNFIAFWLPGGFGIGILDVSNKNLKTYCIHGNYSRPVNPKVDINGLRTNGDLVWLPNNNQLLVEVFNGSGDSQQAGIGIIDLEHGTFDELKWNASFPVWLK
jgi:hypothetical protein